MIKSLRNRFISIAMLSVTAENKIKKNLLKVKN